VVFAPRALNLGALVRRERKATSAILIPTTIREPAAEYCTITCTDEFLNREAAMSFRAVFLAGIAFALIVSAFLLNRATPKVETGRRDNAKCVRRRRLRKLEQT
jgi:hypothetical protein